MTLSQHHRNVVLLTSLCAGLLLLAACGEDEVGQTEEGRLVLGQSEVEQVETRGVAPGGRTLVLEGFSGRIRLEGTAANTADLDFIKRARARDDEAARALLQHVTIDEAGTGEVYRYTLQSEDPDRTAVDVVGEVPRATHLRIQLESGSVALSGIHGPIEVTVENGNIDIGGSTRSVAVETRNGAIEVGLQRLPADAAVTLSAGNGNIAFTIPESADARLQARTDVGSITVQDLAFVSRELDPQGAGARFTGRLGSGNADVDIETQNGTILLRGGTVERLTFEEEDQGIGVPSDAVEEGLTPNHPRTPIPMQDSLRRATPAGPDTSVLRPDGRN